MVALVDRSPEAEMLMASRGMVLDRTEGADELARAAERSGFAAVWALETKHESVVQATLALRATTHIDVGTNVTLAFPRSPTVTAMQAWDLNGMFDDRFVLGLGSQIRRIVEERFSADFDRPAHRMEEYVRSMRAVWGMEQGDATTFEGDIYRVLRPGVAGLGSEAQRRTPRVQVAGVGPLMVRTATRVGDGLLGHPFTSERYLEDVVLARVEAGLEESGRSRGDFQVSQGLIVSISDDRHAAMDAAKRQVGFYATTPNYGPVLACDGDDWLTDALQRAWRRSGGDAAALAAVVPDDVVERYAVVGTPDEVVDRLACFEQHADHVVLSGPWYGIDPQRVADNTQAVLETLAPKRCGPSLPIGTPTTRGAGS